jgi:signal transduction histidine kinase
MREKGGVLELSVSSGMPVPPGVLFPPEHDGHFAVLAVSDSGSGMDVATSTRIFEPFFSTKPGGKGTGMGLPVVKRIIEELQGTLRVRSSPGQGCCFEVFFPLPDPAP